VEYKVEYHRTFYATCIMCKCNQCNKVYRYLYISKSLMRFYVLGVRYTFYVMVIRYASEVKEQDASGNN